MIVTRLPPQGDSVPESLKYPNKCMVYFVHRNGTAHEYCRRITEHGLVVGHSGSTVYCKV